MVTSLFIILFFSIQVVLSTLVACGLAAPAAEADAQILAGGVYGHGLLGHGLLGGVYASGPAPLAVAHAAPLAVAHAAPIAVAHAAPLAVAHAAPLAVAHAAPVAVVHAAPLDIATAPVVHQVGYQVHLQVNHVPQVSVQKHVSTHSTHHVINHAPVIGAYAGLHGLPVAVAAAPAVVADEE